MSIKAPPCTKCESEMTLLQTLPVVHGGGQVFVYECRNCKQTSFYSLHTDNSLRPWP
jgi:hypothetical protein